MRPLSRIWIILPIVFLLACATALLVGLMAFQIDDIQRANEQRMTSHFITMLMGFPAAFFLAGALSDLGKVVGLELFSVSTTMSGFVRDWLFIVAIGYIQWFVLLPALWRLIAVARGKRKRPKSS